MMNEEQRQMAADSLTKLTDLHWPLDGWLLTSS